MHPNIASSAQPPIPAPTPAPIFALVLKPGTDWLDVGAGVCVAVGDVDRAVDDARGVEVDGVRLDVGEELAEALLGLEEAVAVALFVTVLGTLPPRNDIRPPLDVGRIKIGSSVAGAVKATLRNEVSVGHQQAGAGPTTSMLSVDDSSHKVH